MSYTGFEHFSDDELMRLAEINGDNLILELANRLDKPRVETINGYTEDNFIHSCIGHLQNVSGEDYHSEIINMVRKLTKIKILKERSELGAEIIEVLENMDYQAANLMNTIKVDGMFL